jgi:hypothetical protein
MAFFLVQLEARAAHVVEADNVEHAQRKVYAQLDPDVDWDVVCVRPAKEEEL